MKISNRTYAGQIRIIGGQWRGRKLPVITSPDLRPTTNRIRETLFNWLGESIINANCLDCFAGSGALGIEALSRYAANSTLLEIDSNIAQQIQENLIKFKIMNAIVLNIDTLIQLAQTGTPYDIIFIDPPFNKGLLLKTLALLDQNGWIANDAFIYIENKVKNNLTLVVPKYWILYREKATKRIAYRLYRYEAQRKS